MTYFSNKRALIKNNFFKNIMNLYIYFFVTLNVSFEKSFQNKMFF